MPPTEANKAAAPTFRDVVMACTSPKVAAKNLKAMPVQASRHTMLRALNWLDNNNHKRQAEILFKHMNRIHPTAPPEPSRVKPKPGDVRRYSVQRQKSGLFGRIPVELLGVKKGDDVVAEFMPKIMPGVIIVRVLRADERRSLKKMGEAHQEEPQGEPAQEEGT